MAPQASFLAVKVLDQDGAGYLSDFINGLQWVYDYNNGSPIGQVGQYEPRLLDDSPPLKQAIQALYKSGVIMVASAGNRCAQSPGQDEGGGDGLSWRAGPGLRSRADRRQVSCRLPLGPCRGGHRHL